MIEAPAQRAAHINALLARPYVAGAAGPDAFDCYGLTRHLQMQFWGRELPLFHMPAESHRFALASAIAAHPERGHWQQARAPVDGAVVVMARQGCGFHLGTYVDLDGGLTVHTLEETGVVVDDAFRLAGPTGRWRLVFYIATGSLR